MATILAGVAACGSSDPEAEIRAWVGAAEEAAEGRDTGFFRAAVSEDFIGRGGLQRSDLIDRIRAYFLINNQIEVLNSIRRVELLGTDAAEVEIRAALIGRGGGASVLGIDADFYLIEVELVRSGSDWQIIGADWQRALD